MLGKEAQMMATLHSTADQAAAATLSSVQCMVRYVFSQLGSGIGSSQVGSVELETSRRLRKRRMVVSMTLSLVSLMCTFILAQMPRDILYAQSTKGKNTHQGQLLLSGQLERLEDGHRQYQDDQIGQNVNCRIREPESLLVETEAWHRSVPEFGDRYAVRPGTGDCPCSVNNGES